ncbi:MAG: helix-turn-helix domain-containing protein [Bacteroidia bacterium]
MKNGSLLWENIKIKTTDEHGKATTVFYELDPVTAYENSEPDPSKDFEIGQLIKNTRKAMGLTQSELAKRSGTSKHYISRLENNKSGIELSTLRRVIEGGLGKELRISII